MPTKGAPTGAAAGAAQPGHSCRTRFPGMKRTIRMVTTTAGLEAHGISPHGEVFWNPTVSMCYMHALARERGSSPRAGRSSSRRDGTPGGRPRTGSSSTSRARRTASGGARSTNPSPRSSFESLRERSSRTWRRSDVYVVDAFAGADPAHRIPVRVVTGSPWHALFARTLFIDPDRERARATSAAGGRPPRPGGRGRPGGRRDTHRDVRPSSTRHARRC